MLVFKFQIFSSSSPCQAIMRYWKTKKKKIHIFLFFNLNGVKRIYMVSDNHDNVPPPPPRVALTGLASLKVLTKHFQENVELVSEGRIVLPRQEG